MRAIRIQVSNTYKIFFDFQDESYVQQLIENYQVKKITMANEILWITLQHYKIEN